jgi:hypothetical protein
MGQGRHGGWSRWGRGGRSPIRRRGCGGSARPSRWSGAGRGGCAWGDAEPGAGVSPGPGPVAVAVVADHALDGDPGGGVPGCCAGQERSGGFFRLVGQDLGIGEPRVVLQGSVQVAVADDRPPVLAGCGGALSADRDAGAAVQAGQRRAAGVVCETWNRSAARRTGQPSSTTHQARRSRQRSIAVDQGDLPVSGADCGDLHRSRRSSLIQDHQPVSPPPTSMASTPNLRPWPSHVT